MKIIIFFTLINLISCVQAQITYVREKGEPKKIILKEFTDNKDEQIENDIVLTKISPEYLEFKLNYNWVSSLTFLERHTYSGIKKMYLPCDDIMQLYRESHNKEIKLLTGKCINTINFFDNTYDTKSGYYSSLFLSTIFIVGLIPSWYSHYNAIKEEGKSFSEVEEKEVTKANRKLISDINGILYIGSNLKSLQYSVKYGKVKIPTNEYFKITYESLDSIDTIDLEKQNIDNFYNMNYVIREEDKKT
ncbi:MAG: hypothetical protein KDK36_18235, partial [Leptospiraceae bacterium]|nr:hypothetical protein [Leptospiraceae bacterium]